MKWHIEYHLYDVLGNYFRQPSGVNSDVTTSSFYNGNVINGVHVSIIDKKLHNRL